MTQRSFSIGIRKLHVWPERQALLPLDEPSIRLTTFADIDHYHEALKKRTLELRDDARFKDYIFHGGCGTKVRRIHEWGRLEADLIHARAIATFKQVYGDQPVLVDDCWASVYEKGDYCMPHSHTRSIASVLYMLDPGDQDEADRTSGKFCFADPRIPACCHNEEDRMTELLTPALQEGSMLIFPSEWVHLVTPYAGNRPRITMSWNLHTRVLPGKPGDYFRRTPAG
jgi:hypothetical protein